MNSFRELKVYQKLKALHLEVHHESLRFPKFETYELGSQVRRSSNSAPALIAEGWGSRHTNMYIEAINRALGEVRETQHHLDVARDKKYLHEERFSELDLRYDECGRMLEGLHQSLSDWAGTTRTGKVVREEQAQYGSEPVEPVWTGVASVTNKVEEEFSWKVKHLSAEYHPTPLLRVPNTNHPTPNTSLRRTGPHA